MTTKLLFIPLLLLISCSPVSYQQLLSSPDYIRLQKGGCMMHCTESDFIINKKGQLFYQEKNAPKYRLEISGKVSKEMAHSLWVATETANLESLNDNYGAGAEDTQLKTLYWCSNNKIIKKINYKHGEPASIRNLEKQIAQLIISPSLKKDTTFIELKK